MAADIDDSSLQLSLEKQYHGFNILTQELLADAESAASVVRHAAAKKYHEVGPMEAAAAEAVLKKASGSS